MQTRLAGTNDYLESDVGSVSGINVWADHPEAIIRMARKEIFRGQRADQAWNLVDSLVGINQQDMHFQCVRPEKGATPTAPDMVLCHGSIEQQYDRLSTGQ